MKFPITRESLQAFDFAKEREELREEAIQNNLYQLLDIIRKEFKSNMYTNSKEKKYIWRNLHMLRNLNINNNLGQYTYGSVGGITFSQSTTPKIDEYIPRFIDMLKETFIGCDIIVDPLKTYLIIDWN
jgi:hypothetical protein